MNYPPKFYGMIASEQFLEAASFAANLAAKPVEFVSLEAAKSYGTGMIDNVVDAAFTAGAFDQLRAIKDDPACAPFLSEQVRYRIQNETPTLIMSAPALHRAGAETAPTDFDDDVPTNPRGTVVAG